MKFPFRLVAVALILCVGLSLSALAVGDEGGVVNYSEEMASVLSDPASASGLTAALTPLFGEYSPRMQTVTVTTDGGDVVTTESPVPGLAGVDVPWVASVLLFALVLFCFFRLVGVLIKK